VKIVIDVAAFKQA
jgi:ketosteroid isomerase-like protein